MHLIVSGLCDSGAVRVGKIAREVRCNQTKALKKTRIERNNSDFSLILFSDDF